jgi:hypothetical protein
MLLRLKRLPFFFLLCCSSLAFSTPTADNPVEYMALFTQREEELAKNYLSYMSEVAHGSKARRMEKRRNELIASLKEAIREGSKIKPYNGDASLRDAFKSYWGVLLSIFTEDYSKLVDMEEIAERSYDAMEAYLLTQEKAEEKLDEAYKKVPEAYNAFAAKNNVRLNEGQSSKLNRKLDQVGKVNAYNNKLFLICFKSSVQETLMLEAVGKADINGVEQNKNSLLKYAVDGLGRLDSIKPYNNDGSLVNACRKVLEFQKTEAEKKAFIYSDFLIRQEDFDKLKKSFDSKPASKRTKQDIDGYNKAVADHNKSINDFNKASSDLHNTRNKVMTQWDASRKRFMDSHMPHKM